MSAHIFLGVAALAGIFVGLPVLLFYALRRLARPLIRAEKRSSSSVKVTRVGYIFYGAQVLSFLSVAAAYNLDERGHFGATLHTTAGIIGVAFVFILGSMLADGVLRRLGYPILRRQGRRDA
jgi:hypothetical protein